MSVKQSIVGCPLLYQSPWGNGGTFRIVYFIIGGPLMRVDH